MPNSLTETRPFARVAVYPPIDDGNPYLRLFYEAANEHGVVLAADRDVADWDVLHVHWPDLPLASRYLPLAVSRSAELVAWVTRARTRGAKVVWTVHNARSHEGWYPRLERQLFSWFTNRVDAITSLSETGLRAARELHPALRGLPQAVTPHGPFDVAYGDVPPRVEGRSRYGLPTDADVVLHFGHLRPYKGSMELAEAFRRLPGDGRRLIIAGRARPAQMENALSDAVARDPRIVRLPGRIPDQDVPLLLAAADVLVLPYRRILHSGAAILGLSYGCPVVAPALGALPELARSQPPGWVRLYDDELDPMVLDLALAGRPALNTAPQLPPWSVGAGEYAALLRNILPS